MSRPSSSWKASRRTRRSRRSSTRPKYPRRDSLHPAGAVACAGLALFGLAGLWLPWGLEAMLLGDLALAAAVWLDGLLAPQAGPSPRHLVALREAPPAFSVGRPGEVTYRWRNGAPRAARLRLREVRPDLLGGAQPPRWIDVPARGEARETVPVNPARHGRQPAVRGGAPPARAAGARSGPAAHRRDRRRRLATRVGRAGGTRAGVCRGPARRQRGRDGVRRRRATLRGAAARPAGAEACARRPRAGRAAAGRARLSGRVPLPRRAQPQARPHGVVHRRDRSLRFGRARGE